ncbi:MAG: single-stranded-DNA-specific exonuclease RecJ [bacterium]
MKSNWLVYEKFPDGFGKDWNYSEIILQLLWNRGIKNKEAAEEFFNPDFKKSYDPYLFPDMPRAVERIFLAKEKNEVIFVYADYDADGVPGGVILHTVLKAYGMAPKIYIPHREKEGYGLNNGAIDFMAEAGAKVIITCDCGISNNAQIAYAKSKGIDVIITDHHTLPAELTHDVYAIIHPEVGNYPFKGLSGGGVAYKLAQGILRSNYPLQTIGSVASYSKEGIEKWLLDMVAISTVADIMPLIDENRLIVKYGLMVLNKTKRLGLKKLIEGAGLKFGGLNTHSIGYQIAPRINAAGRMDHANAAFALLMEEDDAEAERLAEMLNKNNSDRQKQTEVVVKEAEYQIVSGAHEKDYCLFAHNPAWPLGLLGLAAGKISNKFHRPVILLTDVEEKTKGSARGIAQWNVILSLQKISDLFSAFGGHPMAAGLTLKNQSDLEIFKERLSAVAKADLQDKELLSFVQIDTEADIDEVNLKICETMESMEPCGEKNPRPVFLSRNLEVRNAAVLGNGEKHLKLMVSGKKGVQYKMIGFCFGHLCASLKFGDKIDVVYEPGINEWNGRREAQMKIVDMEKIN